MAENLKIWAEIRKLYFKNDKKFWNFCNLEIYVDLKFV